MAFRPFPTDERPARLSENEAETLAIYVGELSAANLPLAPALRAAGEEVGDRLAATFFSLADAVDRGERLEDALTRRAVGFPRYFQGLVRAALRTGALGETLIDLVEHRRAAREQWRSVVSALAYPAILMAISGVSFLVITGFIAPILSEVIRDFHLNWELSFTSVWVIAIGSRGPTVAASMLAVLAATAAVLRLALGAERWRRLVAHVPLFGPLWHWSAVAEMARLAAALVARQVPLPETLRLTAEGVADANVAGACRELAAGVEQGRDLAVQIAVSRRLPASLAPLVRWGQVTGRLDEAFEAAAEMLEGRVRLRAAMLRAILPPFIFLGAASLALSLFVGLFGPIVYLIEILT